MNKKVAIAFSALIPIVMLVGCENSDIPSKLDVHENDQIYKMVNEFYHSVYSSTRAENITAKVIEVERKHYRIISDTVVEASDTRSCDNGFDLATVTLQFPENKGYALLSDDERINTIFFFTEKGCISDTTAIPPLKDYIESLPKFVANTFLGNDKEIVTKSDTTIVWAGSFYGPLVRFKWGQLDPFNRYMPPCNCSICQGHFPTGCIATAVCQFLATTGKFNGTFYGNKNIDFSKIPSSTSSMSETQKQSVAQFFHEVTLCIQTKFGCGSSGTSLKAVANYLRDMCYDCSYEEGGIDDARLKKELSNGIPHIISGKTRDGKGHSWLIDGIWDPESEGLKYYLCNWGYYGDSNGPVLYGPYQLDKNTIYSQSVNNIYINSKNW